MASKQAITKFLATLSASGLLTERKGAPSIKSNDDRASLATFWHTMLGEDVSDAQLAVATAAYLRDPKSCQWYPQPGTLLAHLPGWRETSIDNSDELWGHVTYAVRVCGYYSKPAWTGPDAEAIEAGIQALGGWQHLCSTLSVDNQMAERASFRAVVRTIQQRKALALEAGAVAGIAGLLELEEPDAEH